MNDNDGWRHANDEWRNDPERRAEWERVFAQRAEAFKAALAHVAKANEILYSVGHYMGSDNGGGNAIWNRSLDAVSRCRSSLLHDERFITDEPNETLIGNYAAFGRPTDWT